MSLPPSEDDHSAAPSPHMPARGFGAPREAGVPRMENVRITAPDLARRAALEKTRSRLVYTAAAFGVLFTAVSLRLAIATVIAPLHPQAAMIARPSMTQSKNPVPIIAAAAPHRAAIIDRNGQTLAVSLVSDEVYADPRQMIDTADAARKLKSVLPDIDEADVAKRLASAKDFVYIARRVTPRQELAVNTLGIPGIDFRHTERRIYPLDNVAAQVLGGVNVDQHGIAGVEKYFDHRLDASAAPLRLSLDIRIQGVVRDELLSAMTEFNAIDAAGIVMDVNTGEVLAMVSLPDYDANTLGTATPETRRNHAVNSTYEPGSTFKLQTAAMALDSGVVNIWNQFNAADPIHIGRFTITDFQGKHRWLYLPEVLAYSSNLGAARIAQLVGPERQRTWLGKMGMFEKVGIELPEAAPTQFQSEAHWSRVTTMTVGFGHGIAVTPLHVVRGTAALVNGGVVLRPTILARSTAETPVSTPVVPAPPRITPVSDEVGPDGQSTDIGTADVNLGPAEPVEDPAAAAAMPPEPPMPPPVALDQHMMKPATSDIVRKLMRLVVTNGYGKPADVLGYYVGGKTGTAEKVGHGAYQKHSNVSAFICVFPMNHPRYAVYMMLDDPKGNASTGYYSTAGAVSAPAAGKVIARIAPMLGLYPDTQNADAINASLYIPLTPTAPAGAAVQMQAAPEALDAKTKQTGKPAAGAHDHRHEAALAPHEGAARATEWAANDPHR